MEFGLHLPHVGPLATRVRLAALILLAYFAIVLVLAARVDRGFLVTDAVALAVTLLIVAALFVTLRGETAGRQR